MSKYVKRSHLFIYSMLLLATPAAAQQNGLAALFKWDKQQTTPCCLSPAFHFLLPVFTKKPNCPQYHISHGWCWEIWLVPDEAGKGMRCDFFLFFYLTSFPLKLQRSSVVLRVRINPAISNWLLNAPGKHGQKLRLFPVKDKGGCWKINRLVFK